MKYSLFMIHFIVMRDGVMRSSLPYFMVSRFWSSFMLFNTMALGRDLDLNHRVFLILEFRCMDGIDIRSLSSSPMY